MVVVFQVVTGIGLTSSQKLSKCYTDLVTGNERWLSVPGYPGYEVSDQGRVRSLDREVRSRWGTPKTLKGKILSQRLVGGNGSIGRYRACTLFRDGERKPVTVHILMLETFVSPRPEGMWGCHRDDNPANNSLENLYWGSPSENVFDKVRNGHHPDANKTHCPQGHEYTEENTYIKPRTGHRECRTCHCDQVKRAYRRSKQRYMA